MNHPARDVLQEIEWIAGMGLGFVDLTLEPPKAASWSIDRDAVRHALERLDVAPHESVYVGDSYGHDVRGAEGAGLRAILLDPLDLYRDSDCPRIRALGELVGEKPQAFEGG